MSRYRVVDSVLTVEWLATQAMRLWVAEEGEEALSALANQMDWDEERRGDERAEWMADAARRAWTMWDAAHGVLADAIADTVEDDGAPHP